MAYYAIDEVFVDLVISDTPLTQSACTGPVQLEQEYSIAFISTPKGSVDKVVQGRSGNPGYIAGLPLLVGKEDPANADAKLVYEHGFKISGVDRLGTCIKQAKDAETYYADFGDPVLNFGEDLIVSCAFPQTLAELTASCT